MALIFGGTSFVGTHGPVITAPSQLQVARTKFWGVNGESEIVGYRGGRSIVSELWLHNNYSTAEQVYNEMQAMDAAVGRNEDLIETGISRIWYACTFMGFEEMPPGIIPVVGGGPEITGSWFVRGMLHFYCLRPPG